MASVTTSAGADVIVVGAGPAGSATAAHLAHAGVDVLLLEKSAFPREKVCGDGLTPRGTAALVALGIDVSEQAGWVHNKGLRVVGGGNRIEIPWPQLAAYPDYGLVRPRSDLDEMLARHAALAGARLCERTPVTAPVVDPRSGRIVGVRTRTLDDAGRPTGDQTEHRARLVVAADGTSSRLAVAMGLPKRDDRPIGIALRTYYSSPRSTDDYLESHLDIREGRSLLPGYGWIFGMGDGRANVGIGVLDANTRPQHTDYRELLRTWLATLPEQWQLSDEFRTQPVQGAALPMAFSRQPHYSRGLVLVGDAGGSVNPFNGEGIPYALETGEIAARSIVQALSRSGSAAEQVMVDYQRQLKARFGGYFTLGRWFLKLIANPEVMRFAAERGLTHPRAMRAVLRLLSNLTDTRGGDGVDRVLTALARVVPAA